tara:strand:+ start:1762 stop:1869 length:108 start_codon:yes stop_codon:yes gene_type:complete
MEDIYKLYKTELGKRVSKLLTELEKLLKEYKIQKT